MQFQRADAFAMTDQAASDHDLPCRAAGLDTEWDGRKSEDDALDQRIASTPIGLNASAHADLTDRLAELDAHRPIRVGDNTLKLRRIHRTRIDIETAGSLPERFDRCVHLEQIDGAEIDETNAAWTIRGNLVIR